MPTNHTPHYNLNQWERDDRILMEDFNADNAKIDTALAGLEETAMRHTSELARKGNCEVALYTYKGTGTYGRDIPTVITFPEGTFLLCIIAGTALYPLLPGTASLDWHESNVGHFPAYMTWTKDDMSIWSERRASYQFNGGTYTVISFRMADRT
jgi:hypothetical protein